MTERTEMEAAIEAILFVASEPVPRTRLVELFEDGEHEQAAEALAAVLERYRSSDVHGVMVEEVAGGVRFVTRPEMGTWLRRFFDVAAGNKLSMAALETLAIIAYRQPITGPEIQELRSVSSAAVLKTLLEKRLVRIAGRKEVVGKPFLYATTREFLVHFGLNSLRDLPPLEEFEETFGAIAGAGSSAATGSGEMGAWGNLGDAGDLAAGGEGDGEAGKARPAGAGLDAADSPGMDGGEEDREERFLREAAALAESRDNAESGDSAESRDGAESRESADSGESAESRDGAGSRESAESRDGAGSRESAESGESEASDSAESRDNAESSVSGEHSVSGESREGFDDAETERGASG